MSFWRLLDSKLSLLDLITGTLVRTGRILTFGRFAFGSALSFATFSFASFSFRIFALTRNFLVGRDKTLVFSAIVVLLILRVIHSCNVTIR
jgi:hypothetical protein